MWPLVLTTNTHIECLRQCLDFKAHDFCVPNFRSHDLTKSPRNDRDNEEEKLACLGTTQDQCSIPQPDPDRSSSDDDNEPLDHGPDSTDSEPVASDLIRNLPGAIPFFLF